MDYGNKWVIGFGTMPYIVISYTFFSFIPNLPVVILAIASFIISTICYQKLILTASKSKQCNRFWLFFTSPIIIIIGLMYV
jgi:hypothetical protein